MNGEKGKLINTATGEEERYLTDEYKEKQENPPSEFTPIDPSDLAFSGQSSSGTILRPGSEILSSTPSQGLFIPENESSIWDAGFSGDNWAELNEYRAANQSQTTKLLYTIGGGIVSGIGTFMEDVGYLLDYATYAAMFSNVDFSTSESMNLYRDIVGATSTAGKLIKESTKDEIFPVYETPSGDSYSDQLFKWGSLKSIIDSAVGFTLTGLGAGTVVKGLVKATVKGLSKNILKKSMRMVPETMSAINKSRKVEAMTQLIMQKNPKLFQYGTAGLTSIFTKGAEARMEGLEAYEYSLYEMRDLIRDGIINEEEAEKAASESANEAFDYTMSMFIGDVLMLKGLTKVKGIASKKLSSPTLWNRNKEMLAGAPKEGFEEMWQESAKQEGNYWAFQYLKDSMKKDTDLKRLKSLGLDPSSQPERWFERFSGYMSSTESLVAGTIGLISGPLQAKALSLPGRKERIKQEWEQFDKQQDIYKNNKQAFASLHKFKENAKQTALNGEMEEVAQLLDDDQLSELREDIHLTSIAATNFINGTHAQLKSIIKEENTPESTAILSKLTKAEKDFKKAKKFANPNEMFVLGRNIEATRKAYEHFKAQSTSTEIDTATKNSYIKSANQLGDLLNTMENEFSVKSSRRYQLNLKESEIYAQQFIEAQTLIGSSQSISELQRIKSEFPELKSQANDRIKNLQNIGSLDKKSTSKTKSVNKTDNKSNHSPDLTTDEGQVESIANKKSADLNLTKEETKFYNKNKAIIDEKIQELQVEQPTNQDNEGNKYGGKNNDILIQSEQELKDTYFDSGVMQKVFTNMSEQDSRQQPLQATPEMFQEVIDSYTELVNDSEIVEEVHAKVGTAIANIYKRETEKEKAETELVDDDITPEDQSLSAQSGLELLQSLSEDVEELPSEDPFKSRNDKIKEQTDKLIKFIDDVRIETGRDLFQEPFKSLIEELERVTDTSIKPFYTKLKGLYTLVTGTEVSENYNELLNIEEPDSGITAETVTPDKLTTSIDVAVKYVSTTQNSTQLQEIYTNSEVTTVGGKNKVPATSIAYLDRDYMLEYVGDKLVQKTDISESISGNVIKSPYRFNKGTPIKIELDKEYKGRIKTEQGNLVKWEHFLSAHNKDQWDKFLKDNKLPADRTIYDYWPLKITGIENNEFIGHVHNTSWINGITTNPEVIDSNIELLSTFRTNVIQELQNNPDIVFETAISEKVIELGPTGYLGFALNKKTELESTSESMPDPNLKIGTKVISDIEIPGNSNILDSTMNRDLMEEYGSGLSFLFVPLGEKSGKMVYHADPLFNNSLTPNQSKTIRQAVEIFISQNENINLALYDSYSKQNIDLKDIKGVEKLLKKLVRLYTGDSLAKTIQNRQGKSSMGFIEVDYKTQAIRFGKSVFKEFKKGQLSNLQTELDKFEKYVLPAINFNISKDLLNKSEKFKFVEVNTESNKLDTYEGDYNTFVKQNTKTLMRSTELDDGTYSSTEQIITRFDMKNLDTKQEKQKEKEDDTLIIPEDSHILSKQLISPQTLKKGDIITYWFNPKTLHPSLEEAKNSDHHKPKVAKVVAISKYGIKVSTRDDWINFSQSKWYGFLLGDFTKENKSENALITTDKSTVIFKSDLVSNKELISLSNQLPGTIDIYIKPILEGKKTLNEQLKFMKIAVEANNHSNQKC